MLLRIKLACLHSLHQNQSAIKLSFFQFGDIICYKTRCNVGVRYKHFAVYVGDVRICGKEAWQDIFEQSKKYHGKSCIFAKLKTYDEPEVNNYLDDYTDPLTGETYGKGDDEDIIARITETYESCSVYGSLHNNCEHLATYVRYGVRIAVQVRMNILLDNESKNPVSVASLMDVII
uniref:LRAT domain-containing protein n=1 Tax=Fundulus heteroclitus TaxID=8078 RepID=A0A3Q2SZ15_FUNHE